jgi:hypothetical protein
MPSLTNNIAAQIGQCRNPANSESGNGAQQLAELARSAGSEFAVVSRAISRKTLFNLRIVALLKRK